VLQSLFCQFKGVRATPALPQLTLNVGSVENSSKDDLSVQKRVCIESSILGQQKKRAFFSVILRIPKKRAKSTGLKDLMENPIMEVDGKTGWAAWVGFHQWFVGWPFGRR